MARANCRCGESLEIPRGGVDHVICPRCEARVRIIRKPKPSAATEAPSGDGYLRFSCPCGRRLKVNAADRPTHGKCPDCGRVVPVPADVAASFASAQAESPTEEMSAVDAAALEAWAQGHLGPKSTTEMAAADRDRRAESSFRVCPRCGKPIHLGADACRNCGTSVPKR